MRINIGDCFFYSKPTIYQNLNSLKQYSKGMNYFILPVIINDRREINLSLQPQQGGKAPKYIVELNENVHVSILSILSDSILKTLIPDTKDVAIASLRPVFELNGQCLSIYLKPQDNTPAATTETAQQTNVALTYDDLESYRPSKKQEKAKTPGINSNSSVIGSYQGALSIHANTFDNGALHITASLEANLDQLLDKPLPQLEVKIIFEHKDSRYEGTYLLAFAHPEHFIGLGLDFGSESSQMAVKRYQKLFTYQEKKPEHEHLFKNIYSYHKAKGWIAKDDRSTYFQEEPNTSFYKSIFFLKEDLSGDYEDIEKELFIQDLSENLKMLVNSSSREEGYATLTQNRYHQLPNLKITHKYVDAFGGLNFNITKEGYEVNVSLSEIKNKTYNSILRVIVESFLKKEFIKYGQVQRMIRFVLLVPNIYDHQDIRNTQLLLDLIFEDFATKEYKGKILAWEVLTISESDASFLGYINKSDVYIQKDSDYIIIDAGKGTTDFSIIRTGKDNIFNIKPSYRNGFAGAGNMITFAIFETVIHYIRANASNQQAAYKFINEQLLRNLTDANLDVKNKFYSELERLKYNFSNQPMYATAQWTEAQSGDYNFRNITESGSDITTLIDLLRQVENISDFYGYIQETCNLIAERTVSNLKLVKDNAENWKCKGVILTGRGFMFKMLEQEMRAAIMRKLDVHETRIHTLGSNELKDVCVKGVFNNTVRLNAERIGYPIQIILPEPDKKDVKAAAPTKEHKPKVGLGNRLLNIFFNELNDIESAKAVLDTEQHLAYNTLTHSQIMIGSKRFKIGSSSLFDNLSHNVDADIVFTPYGYLVRKLENGVVRNILPLSEIYDENKAEMAMVVPSLFPNYIDAQHIFSLKREDIKRAPLMPPLPGNNNTPNVNKPKGPQYF